MFVYLGVLVPGKNVSFENKKLDELAKANTELQLQLTSTLRSIEEMAENGKEDQATIETRNLLKQKTISQEKKLNEIEIKYKEKIIFLKKEAADIAKRKNETRNFTLPFINTQLSKRQIILLFTPTTLAFLFYVLFLRLRGMLIVNSGHGTKGEDYWFIYPLPLCQMEISYGSIVKNVLGIVIPFFFMYIAIDTYYWSELQNARSSISDSIVHPLLFGCAFFFLTHLLMVFYFDFKSIDSGNKL